MMNFIGSIIGAFILIFSTQYVVYELVKDERSLNKIRYVISCIIQSFITIGLYYVDQGIIRVIVLYIMIVFGGMYITRTNPIKIIVASFITYIMLFISECIFTLITVILSKIDLQIFREMYFLSFITNFFISIILIGMSKFSPLNRGIKRLIKKFNDFHINRIFIITILSISTLTLLLYYMYFRINALYTILLNLILILIYGVLTVLLVRENNEKVIIKSNYDNMTTISKKYEKVIEKLRMNNHENKNNLIVLKGMVKSSDKKIKEYIDDLINDERKQDNNLLIRTNSIPTGGLQGLIYQKLLDMKEKNIEYHLEVSKDIDKKKIENIDVKINKDLCTIVGVFLDNAIQATENINKKNIGIYLYQEKNVFVISISNTYEGKMDLYKMNDRGYTTKSEGHGYGLSLVKEIIEKSHTFQNDMSICGNVFIQKIKLKLDDDNKK